MNRKTFLQESIGALTAVCLSCAACTRYNEEELYSNQTGPLLTINLTNQLLNNGDTLISNNIIVVRLANGNQPASFTAVQRDCTHAGGLLYWDQTAARFICPVHGSEFSATGIVITGPAFNNLKRYTITLQNNQLLITS